MTPTQCKLLDSISPKQNTEPGDMWYADWIPEEEQTTEQMFSIYFIEEHKGKRKPIVVVLPNGSEFMPDLKSTNGNGWHVTGTPPNITVTPSIQVGSFHGYITNGVITSA